LQMSYKQLSHNTYPASLVKGGSTIYIKAGESISPAFCYALPKIQTSFIFLLMSLYNQF
jgi:hypothetical protein